MIFPENSDVKITSIYSGHFYFLARDEMAGTTWMWGMVPDYISAEALRNKVKDSGDVESTWKNSLFGFLDKGADRTVHEPFRIPMKTLESTEEIFAGFDRFYIVRKLNNNDVVYRMDWNLDELEISYNHEAFPNSVNSIHVGWKHMLLLSSE